MKQTNAFSLLELSIVLVIIGLIAGGIVAGASMIRAAELRAIITEKEQYQTAVYTFRDKYLGLPGDLKNATAFWGEAHATLATCRNTVSTGTETCNGDGDTKVGNYECKRFWQHLANAELISGTYTGVDWNGDGDGDSCDAEIGLNVPSSKLSGAGWGAQYTGTTLTSTTLFDGAYGNILSFGSDSDQNGVPNNSITTATEAWGIDKKLDDGLPAIGKVVVRYNGAGCVDDGVGNDAPDSTDLDSVYELTNDAVSCNLIFRNAF